MTRKQRRIPGEESPEASDLKRINGIGPAVEDRLHRVGIFNFAQLAAFSPADIAAAVMGLSGLSAERITKQDWIGQARKLAEEVPLTEPEEIEQAPNLSLQDIEVELPTPSVEEGASPEPDTLRIERPQIPPVQCAADLLRVGNPQILLSDTHVHQKMLDSNQAYEVHFTLHLTDAVNHPTSSLNYTASAYGRTADQQVRHAIGSAHGTIRPGEEIPIIISGATLPQGVYWLEAESLMSHPLATQETSPDQELPSVAKGHLFEIF